MEQSRYRALIETFLEAYQAFDIDRMVTFLHPECRFENVSGNEVNARTEGIAEFRALAEGSRDLFSARHQRITGYRENADSATVEISFEGVLRVDLPDGPKTGETIRLDGRSVYEFRDGLIIRLTDYS